MIREFYKQLLASTIYSLQVTNYNKDKLIAGKQVINTKWLFNGLLQGYISSGILALFLYALCHK